MTVAHLIALLQQMPPRANVVVTDEVMTQPLNLATVQLGAIEVKAEGERFIEYDPGRQQDSYYFSAVRIKATHTAILAGD